MGVSGQWFSLQPKAAYSICIKCHGMPGSGSPKDEEN